MLELLLAGAPWEIDPQHAEIAVAAGAPHVRRAASCSSTQRRIFSWSVVVLVSDPILVTSSSRCPDSATRPRRQLPDELFREDGQSLSALEARLPISRFGVMTHPEAHPRSLGEQVRGALGAALSEIEEARR